MFESGDIVYGYVKGIYPPHNKYIVTVYRDNNLNIIACFTTSKSRAGVPIEQIKHGAIYKDLECVSYVFEKGIVIGVNPTTGDDFSFPMQTAIVFDYGVREGQLDQFLMEFDNPRVVCKLDKEEYINLVYAMYKSPHTKASHQKILDTILLEHYSKE